MSALGLALLICLCFIAGVMMFMAGADRKDDDRWLGCPKMAIR